MNKNFYSKCTAEGTISLSFKNPIFYKERICRENGKKSEARKKWLEEVCGKISALLLERLKNPNFSLIYEKYIPIQDAKIRGIKKGEEYVEEWLPLSEKGIGDEVKKYFLEAILKSFKFEEERMFIKEKISFPPSKYKFLLKEKPFTTSSRLIIGLGGTSPLETSITLHHTFGIPYIPATALKGVCRMVAFWKIFEFIKEEIKEEKEIEKYVKSLQNKFYGSLQKEKIEVSHEDDKEKKIILGEKAKKEFLKYQLLFGAQDFKALLLFLDSYPDFGNIKDAKIFDLDIINVHYPEYYGGGNVAGDWENPRPIFFLTITPGVPFLITVLFDQYRFEKLKGNEEFEKIISSIDFSPERLKVEEIIKEALEEFGVGAKTSLGYGVFSK